MRHFLMCVVFLAVGLSVIAQETNDFQPSGNPIARIYSNFHSGLAGEDNGSVFEVDRAYLGYAYQMSPVFSASILLEIGIPDEEVFAMVKRYAYFKNAYVRYAEDNLDVRFGIVGMNHFSVQEKFWGYRYIEQSFAGRYKFGRSVDLGIVAKYELADWGDFDVAVVNGDGYSQLQTDNMFEYVAGLTLKTNRKITWRFYMNYGPSEEKDKMVYAAFLGYRPTNNFSVAAEYNLLCNNDYRDGYNQFGYSFYSTYSLKNDWRVFGRYDILSSNTIDGENTSWNVDGDGSSIIAGVEKRLHKNLRVSLNYRDWNSAAAGIDSDAYIYFNVEFKL